MEQCPEDFENAPIYVHTAMGTLRPAIRAVYHDHSDGRRVVVISSEPFKF